MGELKEELIFGQKLWRLSNILAPQGLNYFKGKGKSIKVESTNVKINPISNSTFVLLFQIKLPYLFR